MDIFITGATGYIGGSLAERFMANGHTVRGLVRTRDKADALSSRGITPVLGNLDEGKVLAEEAARADVIVNAASTLHLGAAQALIAAARPGTKVLHTSGIGAYSNDVEGQADHGQVITDAMLPPAGPHPMQQAIRAVEDAILSGVEAGMHSVVLSNALIYGTGLGLTVQSTQVPMMARAASDRGLVTVVGAGANIWSTVHIEDLIDAYLLALDRAPAGSFYFVENGEASFADIGSALASRLGLGQPRLVPLADAAAIYGDIPARYLLATSSRVQGERARRELGWAPKHTSVTDWIASEMNV